MITTLKIPTKPKGKEWSDLSTWWNQLSDKEKAGVLCNLVTAFRGGVRMWGLEDANEITKIKK